MKLRVAKLVEDWDMRERHSLRESRASNRLSKGECVVAFNRARTQARMIDSAGGVHDYYTDPGDEFDLGLLAEMMKAGIFLEFAIGRSERRKASHLRVAA